MLTIIMLAISYCYKVAGSIRGHRSAAVPLTRHDKIGLEYGDGNDNFNAGAEKDKSLDEVDKPKHVSERGEKGDDSSDNDVDDDVDEWQEALLQEASLQEASLQEASFQEASLQEVSMKYEKGSDCNSDSDGDGDDEWQETSVKGETSSDSSGYNDNDSDGEWQETEKASDGSSEYDNNGDDKSQEALVQHNKGSNSSSDNDDDELQRAIRGLRLNQKFYKTEGGIGYCIEDEVRKKANRKGRPGYFYRGHFNRFYCILGKRVRMKIPNQPLVFSDWITPATGALLRSPPARFGIEP
jgi:hypothetical protein